MVAASLAWACFGERGILANRSLQAEVSAREARIREREQTILSLRREIGWMRSDPKLQERWIREELGWVRPGEVLYLFPGDRAADFSLLQDRRLLPALALPAAGGAGP
jgi:cell division protein FtsB